MVTLPIPDSLGWLGHVTMEPADTGLTCPPSQVSPTVGPSGALREVQPQPLVSFSLTEPIPSSLH